MPSTPVTNCEVAVLAGVALGTLRRYQRGQKVQPSSRRRIEKVLRRFNLRLPLDAPPAAPPAVREGSRP